MGGRSGAMVAAALWLGILASRPAGVWAGAAVATAALALAWLAVRAPRRTGAVLVVLVAFLVGWARGSAQQSGLEAARRSLAPAGLHRVRARIVEPPRAAGERIRVVARV